MKDVPRCSFFILSASYLSAANTTAVMARHIRTCQGILRKYSSQLAFKMLFMCAHLCGEACVTVETLPLE